MFELAALAYLIDLCLGEFPWTHPVMLMGNYINWYERRFYRNTVFAGVLLVVSLLMITFLASEVLVVGCQFLPDGLALIMQAIIASTGLAMHMLHANVKAILTAEHPVDVIRYLVSRDTESMTLTDVYKAGIETWAENLSDGVIAPLFYLILFGLPGLAIYKAINTLDSMVAYKTEHYFYFGKAAARLDDLANLIPARLTALIIVVLAQNNRRAWTCMHTDGNKLESPNAGYPIAAMAGALGVCLAGDASYHGQIKIKPNIGQPINPVTKSTLAQALAMKPGIDFILLSLLAVGIYLSS